MRQRLEKKMLAIILWRSSRYVWTAVLLDPLVPLEAGPGAAPRAAAAGPPARLHRLGPARGGEGGEGAGDPGRTAWHAQLCCRVQRGKDKLSAIYTNNQTNL